MEEERESFLPLKAVNTPETIAGLITDISRYSAKEERLEALKVLWNITKNRRAAEMVCAAGHKELLSILLEGAPPDNREIQDTALCVLVNLSIPNSNKQTLLDNGSVEIMIHLLTLRDETIRQNVMEFLAELAFHGSDVVDEIQKHSGFEYFVDVARDNNVEHQLIGLRAIWHVAIFQDRHRNEFIHNTGLERILQLYKQSPVAEVRQVAYNTLEALCQSRLIYQLLLTQENLDIRP